MPLWTDGPLRVFHGTDSFSAGAVGLSTGSPVRFRPLIARSRRFTDFGQGFYTTTRLHQARQWANMRVLRASLPPGTKAIVLAFDLDLTTLARWESLTFVRPTRDYWDLVTDCRHGFAPHQRRGGAGIAYDVVYGPVSVWPQRIVLADCDQISFHTQAVANNLPQPVLAAAAPNDLFP